MALGYSVKKEEKNVAKAKGVNLPISLKYSIEICNYIRGDSLARAKTKLESSISQKKAIPFKRFTNGVGHKSGSDIVSGRFAVKACKEILKLLESAESNAVFKNLNISKLKITHIAASQSPKSWHHGRQRRQKVKSCHLEIILEESHSKKSTEDSKKALNKKQESNTTKESKQKSEEKSIESKEDKNSKSDSLNSDAETKKLSKENNNIEKNLENQDKTKTDGSTK